MTPFPGSRSAACSTRGMLSRRARVPESLEAKLRLFASRGEVIMYDHETFQPQNWSSIFIGHGLVPQAWDPRVRLVPPEEQMDAFRNLLGVIARDVRQMPSVESWLAAHAPTT